ncbi:adenylate kinase isoenzyme 1-like isoform X2 [Hippopotamus amphibius kiboko]|uniref:adenylate kinase isoenzyme 1-like isoform X2 n=1 Tax=Hippopotamus amphibius kiboko TaxID=575201 RepID=UPI00259A56CF|nr:adenylate kinase isoenzyme 1-like isoform X2 [Hippopotamus amphibius kiboko]
MCLTVADIHQLGTHYDMSETMPTTRNIGTRKTNRPRPRGVQSLAGEANRANILTSPLIIFVMGGPGCGKGTQCKNMATKYGFCHMGLGQLLRQEAQQGTRRGQKIRDIMLQGLLVPTGVILDMISDHMLSCPESRGFLIDGFPRELRQAKEFERIW